MEAAQKNFHLFLADHAANERKAASVAMDLIVQYPDRHSLVRTAGRIAEEEIAHFRMVHERMLRLGAPLIPDEKDVYVRHLRSEIRPTSDERLLDRLLVNSLIEARGMERFELLAELFPDREWKTFYSELAEAEMQHAFSFVKEAEKIFSEEVIVNRLTRLLEVEREASQFTSLSGRFH